LKKQITIFLVVLSLLKLDHSDQEKYVAIMDKKPVSEFVDNDILFYGLITNKDTIVWSHIAIFEKIWLLEKAVNM
jgi:hypothetical protein